MAHQKNVDKIENHSSRQIVYSRRKENIIKKANELSTLCDTDVGLIMFSPSNCLTSFASNGRVEDTFLRLVDRPHHLMGGQLDNKEFLSEKLKQIKHEREMLEKIAAIEEFQETRDKLNHRLHEAREKMRYYEPNVEKINSVIEVGVHQQFLSSAIQRIQLLKAKLLGNQDVPNSVDNVEDHSHHEEKRQM